MSPAAAAPSAQATPHARRPRWGAFLTAFGGFWITAFFDTDQEVGFAALALGPLWAFTGSGGGHHGHGSSHGDHSDVTWGDSDCGGGDGGGGGD